MNYHLNEYYRYPDDKKLFKLVSTTGYVFYFECGHWCTDSVFEDLVRVKTGVQVYQDIQLQLF